jgi:hypothetical protein
MAADTADADADAASDDLDRPRFRGCLLCYTAEMAVYAARRARR